MLLRHLERKGDLHNLERLDYQHPVCTKPYEIHQILPVLVFLAPAILEYHRRTYIGRCVVYWVMIG